MARQSAGKRGFSLVELLVAISILSMGLLAVATMQNVAISENSTSHKMMVATELAKEAMEDIMAWDLANPNVNMTVSGAPYASGVHVAGAGTFNVTYSTTIDTPTSGATRVIVTVTETPVSPHAISPVVIAAYKRVL